MPSIPEVSWRVEMKDRVARIQQRLLDVWQEEIDNWRNDLLKDALNPAKMMHFIGSMAKSMGIDISQLAGMVGQQPGFEPYQVLGVDKSASDEEIKRRYRELIHKLHPDTAGVEGTSFLLQMVLAAYKLIGMERGWQ
jgi:hypothetical protein